MRTILGLSCRSVDGSGHAGALQLPQTALIHEAMRLILAALLLAGVACSSSPTEPGATGGTIALPYGETTTVADTRISFSEIVDSRCPKDVVCAWAGDAAVHLQSGSASLVLHTNESAGSPSGVLAGLTITLLEVKPEPISSGGTSKTAYVARLRVAE